MTARGSIGLVLDVGKTHSRVVAFGDDGARLWAHEWLSKTCHDNGRRRVLDTEAVWTGLTSALRAMPDRGRVRWLIPTTHGAAGVLVSEEGRVVPPLDYEAPIDSALSREYERLRPSFVETGSPALPAGLNLGRQLYAQFADDRSLQTAGTRLLTYPQFWAWRLTGQMAGEVTSLGCHTDLWNPHECRPSSLVERLGVPGLLPRRRAAGESLGPLTVAAAVDSSLSVDVEVLCGVHDSNAGLAAFLAPAERRRAVISTGTWAVAMAPGSRVMLAESRDMLLNVAVDGTLVPTARAMLGREHATIAALGKPEAHDAGPSDIAALIRDGVFALPSFVRTGGPFPGYRGRVVGPTTSVSPGSHALADLYAALMLDQLLDLVADDMEAVMLGPMAGNRAISGLLAALRDRPLTTCGVVDTAWGAATLGPHARWAPPATDPVAPWQVPGLRGYRDEWRARARSAAPAS